MGHGLVNGMGVNFLGFGAVHAFHIYPVSEMRSQGLQIEFPNYIRVMKKYL